MLLYTLELRYNVFLQRFSKGFPVNEDHTYQGTENLEVMEKAVRYNAFLTRLINRHAPKQGTIIDFGAGVGTFSRLIHNPERSVVCIEPDHSQAARLSEVGFETHHNCSEIPDHHCDFIYSLNVVEHIEDDNAAIQDMFRVLKPGGHALIYVPAMQILYSALDKKVGHFRRYNIEQISMLLDQNGFVIKEAKYADSLGFFATLAYKLVGNKTGDLDLKTLILYDQLIFPFSRILDRITHQFFGKNVFIFAVKPEGTNRKASPPRT